MKKYIEEIDKHIGLLESILCEEIAKIKKAIEAYQDRINDRQFHEAHVLYPKLKTAFTLLNTIKEDSETLTRLLDSIRHLKQVNKLLSFSLEYSEHRLVDLSVFINTVSNVCLAQLKYIRSQYESILHRMREKIITVWMDRDLARALRLILFINHQQYQRFLQVFSQIEIRYADLSLNYLTTNGHHLHEHIVLRMISNRLTSVDEQRILHTLFPQWKYPTFSQ
ncbi:MAG TPA: hypothetical protein VD884_15325 [Ohtaekwangia sp.]|nr:hypothetical protein [Ohtaekwangia sp.]